MADYKKPVPVASYESKPYWEGVRTHKLLMPHCEACDHSWFPPSLYCPRCRSDRVGWRQASGNGKVFSYVNFHRAYHPGFADERPYCVAIIELDEGPRMLSNVVGIAPDDVRCEMRVKVVFEDITGTTSLPKFTPA